MTGMHPAAFALPADSCLAPHSESREGFKDQRELYKAVAAMNGAGQTLADFLAQRDPLPGTPVDVLLVLGNSRLETPEHAALLYKNGAAKKIVVSGGVGRETLALRDSVRRSKYQVDDLDAKSEAEIFRDILIALGVPADAIEVETASTNTKENVLNSKKLIEDKKIPFASVIVMQHPLLMRRSKATCERWFGPETKIFACAPYLPDIAAMPLEEKKAFLSMALGEVDRFEKYGPAGTGDIAAISPGPGVSAASGLLRGILAPSAPILPPVYLQVKRPFYSADPMKDSAPLRLDGADPASAFGQKLIDAGRAQRYSPVEVLGRAFTVIVENGAGVSGAEAQALIAEAVSRTHSAGGSVDKLPAAIVLCVLDRSPRLFEDGIARGVIGINSALNGVKDERIRSLIIGVGLFRALCVAAAGEFRDDRFIQDQTVRDAAFAYRRMLDADYDLNVLKVRSVMNRCLEDPGSSFLWNAVSAQAADGLRHAYGDRRAAAMVAVRNRLMAHTPTTRVDKLLMNVLPERYGDNAYRAAEAVANISAFVDRRRANKVYELLAEKLDLKGLEAMADICEAASVHDAGADPAQSARKAADDIIKIMSLCEGVENRTANSLAGLVPLLRRIPGAWGSLVKPVLYSQGKNSYYCFEEIRQLDDLGALKTSADVEYLKEFIERHQMSSYDLLKNFLVEGVENRLIGKPLSSEKAALDRYFEEIRYPIVKLYKAYKDDPEKAERLRQRCAQIHAKIIEGDVSGVDGDPLFNAVLMYAFPPDAFSRREQYSAIYDGRSDRPQDTADVPASLQNKVCEISLAQYSLKDARRPINRKSWEIVLKAVSEVNGEPPAALSAGDVAMLGKELAAQARGNTLAANRGDVLKRLYRYYRWAKKSSLPGSLDRTDEYVEMKRFLAETLRKIVGECLAAYNAQDPKGYAESLSAMTRRWSGDQRKKAPAILDILERYRSQPDKGRELIGRVLGVEDRFLLDTVWHELKGMTSRKEIADIISGVEYIPRDGADIDVIARKLQGSDLKGMESEIAAKCTVRDEGQLIRLKLAVSKRKAHGVAGLSMPVCTAPDEELWNRPNFMNVIIYDEEGRSRGGMHLFVIEEGGKKYLTLPGINPNRHLLSHLSHRALYEMLIDYALAIAGALGCDDVLIPVEPTIHSNHEEIKVVVAGKGYQKMSLAARYKLGYSPEPPETYYMRDFFVVPRQAISPSQPPEGTVPAGAEQTAVARAAPEAAGAVAPERAADLPRGESFTDIMLGQVQDRNLSREKRSKAIARLVRNRSVSALRFVIRDDEIPPDLRREALLGLFGLMPPRVLSRVVREEAPPWITADALSVVRKTREESLFPRIRFLVLEFLADKKYPHLLRSESAWLAGLMGDGKLLGAALSDKRLAMYAMIGLCEPGRERVFDSVVRGLVREYGARLTALGLQWPGMELERLAGDHASLLLKIIELTGKPIRLDAYEISGFRAAAGIINSVGLSPDSAVIVVLRDMTEEQAKQVFPGYRIDYFREQRDAAEIGFFDNEGIQIMGDDHFGISTAPFKYWMPGSGIAVDGERIRGELGLAGRELIVLGSPTPEDLDAFMEAYQGLYGDRAPGQRPVVVVAPRDLLTSDRLLNKPSMKAQEVLVRDKGAVPFAPMGGANLLFLKTAGELKSLYAAADVNVVGSDRNIIEAAWSGRPILFAAGPWENNREALETMKERGGALPFTRDNLESVLRDDKLRRSLAGNAGIVLRAYKDEMIPAAARHLTRYLLGIYLAKALSSGEAVFFEQFGVAAGRDQIVRYFSRDVIERIAESLSRARGRVAADTGMAAAVRKEKETLLNSMDRAVRLGMLRTACASAAADASAPADVRETAAIVRDAVATGDSGIIESVTVLAADREFGRRVKDVVGFFLQDESRLRQLPAAYGKLLDIERRKARSLPPSYPKIGFKDRYGLDMTAYGLSGLFRGSIPRDRVLFVWHADPDEKPEFFETRLALAVSAARQAAAKGQERKIIVGVDTSDPVKRAILERALAAESPEVRAVIDTVQAEGGGQVAEGVKRVVAGLRGWRIAGASIPADLVQEYGASIDFGRISFLSVGIKGSAVTVDLEKFSRTFRVKGLAAALDEVRGDYVRQGATERAPIDELLNSYDMIGLSA